MRAPEMRLLLFVGALHLGFDRQVELSDQVLIACLEVDLANLPGGSEHDCVLA